MHTTHYVARRHLDKGQKIALAIAIEPHFAAEAKKRQEAAGERGAEGGRGRKKETLTGKSPVSDRHKRETTHLAARAVGVSGKLVSAAKAIKAADPARFEKVMQGKLSIARAKKEIRKEADEQERRKARADLSEAMPRGGDVLHGDFREPPITWV